MMGLTYQRLMRGKIRVALMDYEHKNNILYIFKLMRRFLGALPLSKGSARFWHGVVYALERKFAAKRMQNDILYVFKRLRPMHNHEFNLIRIGNPEGDGGYVMLDCFKTARIAYSLGVGSDVSWDLDLAERGAAIFQYDYSIETPPVQHPCFHFFPIAISGMPCDGSKTLSKTLIENGHEVMDNMILKVDIEGSEWDLFDLLDREVLLRFSQIACEFHDIANPEKLERTLRVLSKICDDFHCVHLHANNAQSLKDLYGLRVPPLLEATFVRKSGMPLDSVPGPMRRDLDRPNIAGRAEIDLSHLWS
jgi:hypothetical protein